jgi:ribose/xylose/arabinose/galactoside ABC-type transport system permease subunit
MLKRLLGFREFALVVVLVLEILFFALVQIYYDVEAGRIPSWREALAWEYVLANPFLNPTTLLGYFTGAVILAVACIGSCIVIIGGGIDLSVGSVIAFSSVLTASVLQYGLVTREWGEWAVGPMAMATGLAAGGLCGAVSGLLVTRVRLQPFVATLAVMTIARGIALVKTEGRTVMIPRQSFFVTWLGQGKINLGFVTVPILIVVLIVAAVIFTFFVTKMKWGRQVFAVGGNEEAARFCGVRVGRIKMLMYVLAGLLAGMGGVLYAAFHGMGQSSAAPGWELDAIAAAVVGGASLSGGRGSVVGATLGAVFFRILDTALNGIGYGNWSRIVVGVVLILVVLFDQIVASRRPQTA